MSTPWLDLLRRHADTWHSRPYLLSRINWQDPRKDPIFRQFIPLKSTMLPNHPKVGLDSLGETKDEVVKGLVHRYPDKALFLGE
jgi:lysine 2,3-aminomutase